MFELKRGVAQVCLPILTTLVIFGCNYPRCPHVTWNNLSLSINQRHPFSSIFRIRVSYYKFPISAFGGALNRRDGLTEMTKLRIRVHFRMLCLQGMLQQVTPFIKGLRMTLHSCHARYIPTDYKRVRAKLQNHPRFNPSTLLEGPNFKVEYNSTVLM